MDTQKMKYLLKVAELESVTEAAKELYISQPALSQVISYIGKEFGIEIFKKSGRKIVLTFAGKVLLDGIREELRIEENLRWKLSDVKEERMGGLHIGMSHARAVQFLPIVLQDFVREYPDIVLNIQTDSIHGFEKAVVDGTVEFTFVMDVAVVPPRIREQLVYEPLFSYRNLLAVPPQHPIALEADGEFDWTKRSAIDLRRVRNEPFVRVTQTARNTWAGHSLFTAYGFIPKERIVLSDESLICSLVEAGIGFALVQEHHAQARKSGVYFLLDKEISAINLCLIYHKDVYLSKPAKRFIDIVKYYAETGAWQKVPQL